MVKKRGYVDDGFLTSKGQKEDVSAVKIQETFFKVKAWAIGNGMVFDPVKFETTFLLKAEFLQPKNYFAACDNNCHSRKT